MFNRKIRNFAKALCVAMGACVVVTPLTACGGDDKLSNNKSPLVLAADVLDGVFNPFFYTSGSDGEVVSQTQIGMLSSNEIGEPLASWNEPCVAFDYSIVTTGTRDDIIGQNDYSNYYTDYYFALKDDIKFSDGTPLTKRDVLFNIYMYLDPAYTGSSTMYSVKIKGLKNYRAQTLDENDSSASDEYFDSETEARISCIRDWAEDDTTTWSDLAEFEYYDDEKTIESDILKVHALYKEELQSIWNRSLTVEPEKEYAKYVDQNGKLLITKNWQVFLYSHNILQISLEKGVNGQKDYYKLIDNYGQTDVSEKTLIDYVYNSKLDEHEKASKNYKDNLLQILDYTATAGTFREYVKASVISHEIKGESGLRVKTVSGITIENMDSIPYKDGSEVKQRTLRDKNDHAQSYDVLKIRIDGVDPKAIQNFSFTVAPGHHYSSTWNKVTDNNDYFGVEFADPDFMRRVKENHVPIGAGPYRPATENGKPATQKTQFFKDNVVYLVRNNNFLLGAPKIKLLRYKVINNNMLYEAVKGGEVHYASPSMDKESVGKLIGTDKNKVSYASADNLGYGYIGISARFVPDINIRRAIMSTLNPQDCVDYYGGSGASVIYRPMSKTLKKYYPTEAGPYYTYDETGKTALDLAKSSGCTVGSDGKLRDKDGKRLKYTFTIAGNSDDHPANAMLNHAREILNRVGFEIEISYDSTALSKLSSGLLTVWAAAWSSSSDPDMYQVYHKNSTATSTLAWGYTRLKSANATPYERNKLTALSNKIEEAREYTEAGDRAPLYHEALDMLMDLAVEFPTYQRKVYYVWKKGVLDEKSLFPKVDTYRSPLSEIWNVSFNEG